ncbi:MAG: GAF domain-containing protein [Burkholderiales bacterium]
MIHQRGSDGSRDFECRLGAQYATAQILAECETLSEAARAILKAIGENLGWEIGAFWRVDRKLNVIRCDDFWREDGIAADEFESATRARTFARGEGLPGRVWESGEPAWIDGVAEDANFPRAASAGHAGLHAAFAFPVRLGPVVLGVFEFFSREARKPDAALLKVFATIGGQIGQFIERRQAEETIKAISAGTAAATGSDFFQSLVRHLAAALDVRYAFVAECQGDKKARARSRAFWKGDGFGENFEYETTATPCRHVLEGKTVFFPDRLQALFPGDPDLVALNAESYLGVPLLDHARQVIGHLAVLDVFPMETIPRDVSVLQTFASRAGAEIERMQAQERERALLALNNSIIASLKLSELLHATREALKRVIAHDRAAIAIYEHEADDLRVYALDGSFAPDQLVVDKLLDVRGKSGTVPFNFNQPLLRNNLETQRRFSFDEGLLAAGMRSHCILPLVAGDKTIGVLGISSRRKDQFSQGDFAFLREVASQIALAVANVQAYEEIAALKARLQAENVYLRSELIANVSHDLRTLLASLRGYIETLLMKEDTLQADKRKTYLEIVAKQSAHLTLLVEELFELAKLDFKGYELNPEPVKLDELARDIVQKFELAAERKKLKLAVIVGANVRYVQANMGLIERVFENLIENAPKHAETAVSIEVIGVSDEVRVSIGDDGAGIPEKDLPLIFERFYRGEKSRNTPGAGLGSPSPNALSSYTGAASPWRAAATKGLVSRSRYLPGKRETNSSRDETWLSKSWCC